MLAYKPLPCLACSVVLLLVPDGRAIELPLRPAIFCLTASHRIQLHTTFNAPHMHTCTQERDQRLRELQKSHEKAAALQQQQVQRLHAAAKAEAERKAAEERAAAEARARSDNSYYVVQCTLCNARGFHLDDLRLLLVCVYVNCDDCFCQ